MRSDRIHIVEREQFFKAISIVECCEYASSTMAEVATVEYMDGVFDVLLEILNSSAGELGCMVDELGNKKTICA